MKVKDYYKVLGIERTASAAEIKRAYHRLARLYHPDKNNKDSKANDKFRDINEAYEVLGDLDKRLEYSMMLNSEKKLMKEIHETQVLINTHKKKKKLK